MCCAKFCLGMSMLKDMVCHVVLFKFTGYAE